MKPIATRINLRLFELAKQGKLPVAIYVGAEEFSELRECVLYVNYRTSSNLSFKGIPVYRLSVDNHFAVY